MLLPCFMGYKMARFLSLNHCVTFVKYKEQAACLAAARRGTNGLAYQLLKR